MPRRVAFCLVSVLPAYLAPALALASGAFFSNPAHPILQTEEQVIVSFDRRAKTVDVLFDINLKGRADEFAWVLPLPAVPLRVEPASPSVFNVVNQLTEPQFHLHFEVSSGCFSDVEFGLVATKRATDTVQIEGEAGPFLSATLRGRDAKRIGDWLKDRDYTINAETQARLEEYVELGYVLLVLLLKKKGEVVDIQPIHITLPLDALRLPLKLKALSTGSGMPLTLVVLSDRGRAVSKNYRRAELNWAKLAWLENGANYRDLVREAVSEAEGLAFVTEFAGSARIFDRQIYPAGGYDRRRLERVESFGQLIDELLQQGLVGKPGIGRILRRHAEGALRNTLESNAARFDRCPVCFSRLGGDIDVASTVTEIWTRIVEPEARAQTVFDRRRYATRLFTMLSGGIGTDPELGFRPDLPDVPNLRRATRVTECSFPGSASRVYTRVHSTGQEVDAQQNTDNLPATTRILRFGSRTVVDHRPEIERELAPQGACTCAVSRNSFGASSRFGLFMLGMLVLGLRRRERG